MKHGQRFFKISFFILCLFVVYDHSLAMEAVVAEEASALLGKEAAESMSASLAESFAKEVGELNEAVFKELSPEAQNVVREQIRSALTAAEIKPGMSAAEISAKSSQFGSGFKQEFVEKLSKVSGQLTEIDKKAFSTFKLPEADLRALNNLKVSAFQVPAGVSVEEGASTVDAQVVSAQNDATVKQFQANNAYTQELEAVRQGAPTEQVQQLKAESTTAQVQADQAAQKAAVERTNAQTQAENNLKQAQQNEATTKQASEAAAQTGDSGKIADAQEKNLQAQEETKAQTQAKEQTDRLSGKQKIKQAELKRDALAQKRTELGKTRDELKTKLKNATTEEEKTALQKNIDDVTNEYDLTGEEHTQAEQAVTQARQDYLTNTKDWALGTRARQQITDWKNWGVAKATEVSSTLFSALIFMVPSVAMSAWQEWIGKGSEIETLKKPQRFGNILMKLPDEFINEGQPSQSKFIYVGLDTEDRELTSDYLRKANYYVTMPDYGDPGSFALTDPNAPHKMLHLNTGYVFVGDGTAADPEAPIVPLLESDGTRKSLVEIIGLLTEGLQGGVSTQVTTDVSLGSKSASTSSNQTIAELFTKPKATKRGQTTLLYPPLMAGAIKALQQGAVFGDGSQRGPFNLKGISKLSSQVLSLMSGGQAFPPDAEQIPYVAQGVYVYQTQDTPYIKMILNRITSDDQNAARLQKELSDYLLVQSRSNNFDLVSLERPEPSLQAPYFASYALDPNARDDFYLYSLLDGTLYDWSGQKLMAEKVPALIDPKSESIVPVKAQGMGAALPDELASQINTVKAYVADKLKYGPFVYGSTQLDTQEEWAKSGVYVYRVAHFLEGGLDDYVVAVKRVKNVPVVTPLPDEDVTYFVSLVTSRFYDKNFKPFLKDATYNVIAPKSNPNAQMVITGNARSDEVVIMGPAKAPLYALFVQGDINPNKPPAGTQGLTNNFLPVPSYWALDRLSYTETTKVGAFLQTNYPELVTTIKSMHDAWVKGLDQKDPWAIANAMGPFSFTTRLAQNIQIWATSEADIKNGSYVYTSDYYPDEFLVMSRDAQGTTSVGEEFDVGTPQPYIISLSTGTVYENQHGQKVGTLDDTVALIARLQKQHNYSQDLMNKIQRSQHIHGAQLTKNLYGSDTEFGPFSLYINRQDYLNKQYVYADVTGLGSPLNADDSENSSVVDKVQDYFVAYGPAPKVDQLCKPVMGADGKQAIELQLGAPMSAEVTKIISLISGAVYDRGGVYAGSIGQFNFARLNTTDPLAFTTAAEQQIECLSGKAFSSVLQKKISVLTKSAMDHYEQEKKQIEEFRAQEEKSRPQPLPANLIANLLAAPYVPDNPQLAPRYLKFVGGAYYRVTPALQNAGDEAQAIVSYNTGTKKDSGMGVIYDTTGAVKMIMTGWGLALAREAAGVIVAADGTQKLGVGYLQANLPLKVNGKDAMTLTTIPAKNLAGGTAQFYYNHVTDNFYALLTNKTSKKYIDLVSGYAYHTDGSPRLQEGAVYTSAKGDGGVFLIGQDTTLLPKFIFNSNIEGQYVSYSTYKMLDKTTFKENNNDQGIIYLATSDDDPSWDLRIGYAYASSTGAPLPQPYYIIWDSNYTNLGTYVLNTSLNYALLSYVKTRPAGSEVTQGGYVESDAINPDTGKSWLSAVIYDTTSQQLRSVVYANQLLALKGGTSASYIDSSGKNKTLTVRQQASASGARWITLIQDNSLYDYVYDTLNVPIAPVASCGDRTDVRNPNLLNLYCLKNEWKLNVTTMIPNRVLQGLNNNGVVSTSALASNVQLGMAPGAVEYPKGLSAQDMVNAEKIVGAVLGKISQDPSGFVYYYQAQGTHPGSVKRFVYQLSSSEKSFEWYSSSLNNCYVDLANGIMYRPTAAGDAYPIGLSLLPSQLVSLLDTIHISVKLNEVSGLPEKLLYRVAPTIPAPVSKAQATSAPAVSAKPLLQVRKR